MAIRIKKTRTKSETETVEKKPRKRRGRKKYEFKFRDNQVTFDEETGCFILISPWRVHTSTNRTMGINMNEYNATSPFARNNAKKNYKVDMSYQISQLPRLERISVDYEVVFNDENDIHDGMNVASVTSKFFLDALVQLGVIPDDNYKRVVHEEWNPYGVDVNNGRVLIYIKPL